MLTAADFVSLAYTPDLTQAGILHACHILARAQHKIPANPVLALRRLVIHSALDLAFRHYLGEQGVPYQTLNTTPFSRPGHQDVILGGRRCVFICSILSSASKHPSSPSRRLALLQKLARVPGEFLNTDSHFDPEIFIFAFVIYFSSPVQAGPPAETTPNFPAYYLYPMPTTWARPNRWKPLGLLLLETATSQALTLELGGLGADRQYLSYSVPLQPHQPLHLQTGLHTLAYLALPMRPQGRIQIYSSALRRRYVPSPDRWGDLWVQGDEIILTGYMTRGEFRQRARALPHKAHKEPYQMPDLRDMALPVSELHPIQDLLQRITEWQS